MRAAVHLLMCTLAFALLAAGPAYADHNDFNSESLNAVGLSNEQATTTAVATDITYNTAGYTLDTDRAGEVARAACGTQDGFQRAAKTAWTRFVPGVKGRLTVQVESPSYDVMVVLFRTTYARGVRGWDNGRLTSTTCQDERRGVGGENELPDVVEPGQAVLIMTGTPCGVRGGGCSLAEEASTVGGPTTVRFRFTPTDSDGDGVPDTLDACPTVKAGTANGCPLPDRDTDGVPDASDACPDVAAGTANGCPVDSDGDGFADAEDACPFERGIAPSGCPDPDPDRDRVLVGADKCPFEYGLDASGCADPDGDGLLNERDFCPAVKGISTDGCPDGDRDGVSDRTDRCPTLAPRTSTADGCPLPIGADFPDSYSVLGGSTTLVALGVKGAPRGARVTVACARCKLTKKRSVLVKKTTTSLLPLFRSRALRAGDRIEIRVSLKGTLTRVRKLEIRRGKVPRATERCVSATGKLSAC